MERCSNCGQSLNSLYEHCSNCGLMVEDNALDPDDIAVPRLVRVARFTNAAEVGYFTHELMQRESIHAMISVEEDFDALSGSWSNFFYVSVPESVAELTAISLKNLVEVTDTEQLDGIEDAGDFVAYDCTDEADTCREIASDSFETSNDPYSSERFDCRPDEFPGGVVERSNVNWVSIVLTIAAGSVIFWMVRKLNEQPNMAVLVSPAGQQRALWDHVSRGPGPWVQQLGNGTGIRELHADHDRELVIIREDTDGDGTFEKEVSYRR